MKKKALLNFRAIKNNYVVSKDGAALNAPGINSTSGEIGTMGGGL